MARPIGPPRAQLYEESNGRYRVRVIQNGVAKNHTFSTRNEAQAFKQSIEGDFPATAMSRTISDLLVQYCEHRERIGACKPETIAVQLERLRDFFGSHLDNDIVAITLRRAERLYQAAVEHIDQRTGKGRAAATHRVYLGYAKTFFCWAVKENLVKENPFKKVQPVGRVSAGKLQLSFDEGERFIAAGLRRYEQRNDKLALAALVALMMGFRVSEVLSRTVRDLDGNGTYLRIGEGKTKNARRCLRVPAVLAPHLARLAYGRSPDEPLFGLNRKGNSHPRQMMNTAVHRICRSAGVPLVCPHSLRGLWASASVEAGALPDLVAAALGHGTFAITAKHYAQPEAVSTARTVRLEQALGLDKLQSLAQLSVDQLLAALPPELRESLLARVHQAQPPSQSIAPN